MASLFIRVPYSIIFIADPLTNCDTPYISEDIVNINDCCISVGTYPEVDGSTELIITKLSHIEERVAFFGSIRTPSKSIEITDSNLNTIYRQSVDGVLTNVFIWLDDEIAPTKIYIKMSS